jgi:hypothetical protein
MRAAVLPRRRRADCQLWMQPGGSGGRRAPGEHYDTPDPTLIPPHMLRDVAVEVGRVRMDDVAERLEASSATASAIPKTIPSNMRMADFIGIPRATPSRATRQHKQISEIRDVQKLSSEWC